MYKTKIYGSELLFVLILLTIFLIAAPVMAHTHWLEGKITKAPWHERYHYIEIDNKLYTFMPDATLHLRLKNRNGDYDQKKLFWSQIRKGQHVLIDIQGRRIYHFIIQK